jgi:hypothetical protein
MRESLLLLYTCESSLLLLYTCESSLQLLVNVSQLFLLSAQELGSWVSLFYLDSGKRD